MYRNMRHWRRGRQTGEQPAKRGKDEKPLEDYKRSDLDTLAESLGLDPSEYRNKELLIKAIKKKQNA